MRINIFSLGLLATNSYLLDNNGQALVIDAGGDPAPILDVIKKDNLSLTAILITHRHFDHLYGVSALQKAGGGCPAYVPGGDAPLGSLESIWGMPPVPEFEETPFDDTLDLPGFEVRVLRTPGHTPGGVSFYFPEAGSVFTGDVLFYRSIGRTDFPMGNQQALLQSIRQQLFTLPDETVVYPGHGPETTIGDERRHNPFIGDFARRRA